MTTAAAPQRPSTPPPPRRNPRRAAKTASGLASPSASEEVEIDDVVVEERPPTPVKTPVPVAAAATTTTTTTSLHREAIALAEARSKELRNIRNQGRAKGFLTKEQDEKIQQDLAQLQETIATHTARLAQEQGDASPQTPTPQKQAPKPLPKRPVPVPAKTAAVPAVVMPVAQKPASQLDERFRPFCGLDTVHYVLELQQEGKLALLRDVYARVAERARSQFGIEDAAAGQLRSDSVDDHVDAIIYLLCRVRLSDRWNAQVHYYGNEDAGEFAAHLRDAIDYSSRSAGDKSRVELARKRGFKVSYGVHTDGTIYLTKEVPNVKKALAKFDPAKIKVVEYAEDEYCPRCVAHTKDGARCKNYAQCRLVKKGSADAAAYASLCATHFKQYKHDEPVLKTKDQHRCYVYVGSLQSLACEFVRKYGRGESDEAKRYRKSLYKVLKDSTGIASGNTCPTVPVDADIRPYCGAELLVYALELEQCTKTKGSNETSPLTLLYDLYQKVARHAKQNYGVKAAEALEHKQRRSKADLLYQIIKLSCQVRSSKAYKASVHLYGDPEVYAELLYKALKDKSGAKYESTVVACHGDGSFVVTEKLAKGKKKHHVWVGVRGDLVCTLLNRYVCDEAGSCDSSASMSARRKQKFGNDLVLAELYNLITSAKSATSASRAFGRGVADAVGASTSESQA